MNVRRLRPHHGKGKSESGQILLIFAFGLIVFIGFAALTVDVGSLYVARRDYQNATDAAALAGATYLTRPIGDPCVDTPGTSKQVCARTSAWNYLNDHLNLGLTSADITGFASVDTAAVGQQVPTSGGPDAYRIWISTPPNGSGSAASVSTVGDANGVLFVRVDRRRDTFFGKIFVPDGFMVSSWSTAGIFPNRYAVITLRRGKGGTEVDPGPANTTDIKLAGNGSELRVVDGDVGGNWGMKLTADSKLRIYSTTGDEANVYLTDYLSCGNSCWSAGQVIDSSGNNRDPKKLPAYVPDPNYAPPPAPGDVYGNTYVDNASPALDIPNGDTASGPYSGAAPSVTINAGTVTSSGSCVGPSGTTSDAPRLGPGTYQKLRVRNDSCVILDPTHRFTNPQAGTPGGTTDVPATQYAGVYYFTQELDIDNSALIVGDGVTVILRPNAIFTPSSGGVMDLNTGKVTSPAQKLGAWTTKGASSYAWDGSKWVYQAAQETNATIYGVGIALYVLKPIQAGTTDANGSDVIQVSSHAGLSWKGVTYAPNDNVQIAGQPHHDGIGQLISWTFTFNGGTNVTQTFDGPGDGYPYLIEPCVLVGGSCQ